MPEINYFIEYEWVKYLVNNEAYKFNSKKIGNAKRSHYGPQIYLWMGEFKGGKYKGKIGLYIGETKNLSKRIYQYQTGKQKNGNKRVRNEFLKQGNIELFVLKINNSEINLEISNNRKLLESLLLHDLAKNISDRSNKCIVNKGF